MLTLRPKGVQIRSSRRNIRQFKHRGRPLGTSMPTKGKKGPPADLDNQQMSASQSSTEVDNDANASSPVGSSSQATASDVDQSSVDASSQRLKVENFRRPVTEITHKQAESVLGRASELRAVKNNQSGAHLPALRPVNFPLPRVDDHWEACNGLVDRYDNALCEGWNDDINTLLVFVGLFSAAVTAFTIESSQKLERDPADTTNQLLLHISRQLAKEVTSPASIPSNYSASPSDRRVNIFWFLSLLVALMTALLGILCKQWLREYQKDIAMSPRQMLGLRQLRFESFNYWRVEDVIASLPLMLQLTLLLFLVGVLDFLWNCDAITAGIITIAAVLGVGAVFITTILPAIVFMTHYNNTELSSVDLIPVCAYKSPQAWLCLRMVLFFKKLNSECPKSWSHMEKDILWYSTKRDYYTFRAIYWLDELFSHNQNVKINLSHCLCELEPCAHPDIFPWRATEGHPTHEESIFLEGERFDPRIPMEPKAQDQGPWGTLTARILFQYLKNKVPSARDSQESLTLAALRASFAEVTLLLACHSPAYLSHHLQHDAEAIEISPLNKRCSHSITDLYCGPLSVQRSPGPDGVERSMTASFLCDNIGAVIRFFMCFYQDPDWEIVLPMRKKRKDFYAQMPSSMMDWLEETKPSERTYIRYNMLDSIEADQTLLTFELIQNTITDWADRAQRLGLPTFVDFFTVLDFLDRTSDDGSNGREEEWKVLVTEVMRQLERLQSECAYFSLPYSNKQYENQDAALVKSPP